MPDHGPDRHRALELDGEHVGKVGLHGEVEDPGDQVQQPPHGV